MGNVGVGWFMKGCHRSCLGGVGWVMKGCHGSCRGGWVMKGWGGSCWVGVGWFMKGWWCGHVGLGWAVKIFTE